MIHNISLKKLSDKAIIPTRGSEYSAGYDLYASTDEIIKIKPHETVKISTDISLAIPVGYAGLIYARSGIATRHGLRPANCVGVIDSDYRGPIIVALHNDTEENQYIDAGMRIAQLIITPFLNINFKEVDELDETERGDGGFGHTGV